MKLPEIFKDQDDVLENHLNCSPLFVDSLDLLSQGIDLAICMIRKLPFEEKKWRVLFIFGIEIINLLAVAARLALWGNTPESLAIIRISLERCPQMLFIVEEKRYETADHEIEHGFKQVSYEEAVRAMGSEGKRITRRHGEISEQCAHATAARFGWLLSESHNEIRVGPGFRQDDPNVATCLTYCLDSCQLLLTSYRRAYEQDGLAFPWLTQCTLFENKCLDIKSKFKSINSSPNGGIAS